jgi:TolB-like protein
MKQAILIKPDLAFSPVAIEEELQKIFLDPHFTESLILKRFLSFVVQETVIGRSHCLKEYTIAVNVLEKPLNFNPQENCIVRIHAGRLRRALNRYYNELGREDQIVISIPKGKYIPVFSSRYSAAVPFINQDPQGRAHSWKDANITLAILPFLCPKQKQVESFSDGLCLQMSSMLTGLDQVSVIAYQAVKNMYEQKQDYRQLAKSMGFNHIITGGMQNLGNKIRMNIQLIECTSYRHVWSETFERLLTQHNGFDVQDEICECVVRAMQQLTNNTYDHNEVLTLKAG